MSLIGFSDKSSEIDRGFWSGAGDPQGLNPGMSCSNFTNNEPSSTSTVGTLLGGLSANTANCGQTFPLLCLARVHYGESSSPTSRSPTIQPTALPTLAPSLVPTFAPTFAPTLTPTFAPTVAPTSISNVSKSYTGSEIVISIQPNLTNESRYDVIFPNSSLGNGTIEVAVGPRVPDRTVSGVVSVVFVIAGDVQNVTGLKTPVTIRFPIQVENFLDTIRVCLDDNGKYEDKRVLQCGYRNEYTNEWQTDGCHTSTMNKSFVECQCTHLTDFAVIIPRYNKVVSSQFLALTAANIAEKPTGLIMIIVILFIFAIVFLLAYRKDRDEQSNIKELRKQKFKKWDAARDAGGHRTFWKQVKVNFQSRHTFCSLVWRKTGTSFRSVDRTFVALLTVFASMSMSARFHAQDNNSLAKAVTMLCAVLACLVPSQVLTRLFVRTGDRGFFHQWELDNGLRHESRHAWVRYRFPDQARYVWRALTAAAVLGMVIYVLSMSLQFDRQPFFFCKGAPAVAWINTWIAAYAISVLLVEPARVMGMAIISYFWGDLAAEIVKRRMEVEMTGPRA